MRLANVCLSIFLIICLTSCFEIVEDISFKKNGSGTFKYILNFSQSKTEINSLMRMDSSSGFRIPKIREINDKLNMVEQTLKNSAGLSNILVKRDFKNWIFEIKTDFDNCNNLEKAISNSVIAIDKRSKFILKDVFNFEGNTMNRKMIEISQSDIKNMNKGVASKILSKAVYTSVYRFENTIENFSNKKARLSASKTAIMHSCNILKLINGKETLLNTINLN